MRLESTLCTMPPRPNAAMVLCVVVWASHGGRAAILHHHWDIWLWHAHMAHVMHMDHVRVALPACSYALLPLT